MVYITSVGRGIPDHNVEQEEIKHFMQTHFLYKKERTSHYLSVFDHANIDNRQLVMPLQWYKKQHNFHSANKIYEEKGIELSLKALDNCLEAFKNRYLIKGNFSYENIDSIIFVSSTGIATPSIDAHIINQRPFRNDVVRMPLWGLGCAGGAMGISRAFDYLKANPTKSVIVICCELCSLTFQLEDISPRNIVGTALFADGVSATLLLGEHHEYKDPVSKNALSIKNSQSLIEKDSLDIMGWEVRKNGLHVVFSKKIPKLIESVWKEHVIRFLTEVGLTINQINTFVAHPGGRKVLEEMERVCNIPKEKLMYSYQTLQNHGNMSSATVMYVLKNWLESKDENVIQNTYGLLSALGPGFSSELLLLKWVQT